MKKIITLLLLIFTLIVSAQTKVSGLVIDEDDYPIPFANVIFKNSTVPKMFYINKNQKIKNITWLITNILTILIVIFWLSNYNNIFLNNKDKFSKLKKKLPFYPLLLNPPIS